MEDNKLYRSIWNICGIVICVLVVSVSGCTAYESHLVAERIAGGANPVAVRCAMGSVETIYKSIPCYEAAKK